MSLFCANGLKCIVNSILTFSDHHLNYNHDLSICNGPCKKICIKLHKKDIIKIIGEKILNMNLSELQNIDFSKSKSICYNDLVFKCMNGECIELHLKTELNKFIQNYLVQKLKDLFVKYNFEELIKTIKHNKKKYDMLINQIKLSKKEKEELKIKCKEQYNFIELYNKLVVSKNKLNKSLNTSKQLFNKIEDKTFVPSVKTFEDLLTYEIKLIEQERKKNFEKSYDLKSVNLINHILDDMENKKDLIQTKTSNIVDFNEYLKLEQEIIEHYNYLTKFKNIDELKDLIESTCNICDEFTQNHNLCCKKKICMDCTRKWRKESNTCPFCRQKSSKGIRRSSNTRTVSLDEILNGQSIGTSVRVSSDVRRVAHAHRRLRVTPRTEPLNADNINFDYIADDISDSEDDIDIDYVADHITHHQYNQIENT